MTREELAAIPLKYVYGMSMETGAIRVHATEDGRIKRIVRTPKNSNGWGLGTITYALEGSYKEYKTVQELLDAINEAEVSK